MKRWIISVVLLVGCSEEELLQRQEEQVDRHTQSERPKVDILWVVDNSTSMRAEQEKIVAEAGRYLARLREGSLDYHLAVLTTDRASGGVFRAYEGRIEGCDQCRFLDRSVPCDETSCPAAAVFQNLVRVGDSGAALEQAFAQTAFAFGLSEEVLSERSPTRTVPPENSGFLREDADLLIVFASDEEEGLGKDGPPPHYYERAFGSLKANSDRRVHVASIVGWPLELAGGVEVDRVCESLAPLIDLDPANDADAQAFVDFHRQPGTCQDVLAPDDEYGVAEIGWRYIELTCRLGGALASICAADYASTLDRISDAAVRLGRFFTLRFASSLALGPDCVAFSGDEPVIECDGASSGPLCVRASLDGGPAVAIPRDEVRGWSYDAVAGGVVFRGEVVPAPNTTIELRYKLAAPGECAR